MTEKQAAFYSRRSLCRMTALLTSHFAQAQLLTLRYVAGPLIPHAIIDSQYRSLMCKARRLAGGPFPYVKLTQYYIGTPGMSSMPKSPGTRRKSWRSASLIFTVCTTTWDSCICSPLRRITSSPAARTPGGMPSTRLIFWRDGSIRRDGSSGHGTKPGIRTCGAGPSSTA